MFWQEKEHYQHQKYQIQKFTNLKSKSKQKGKKKLGKKKVCYQLHLTEKDVFFCICIWVSLHSAEEDGVIASKASEKLPNGLCGELFCFINPCLLMGHLIASWEEEVLDMLVSDAQTHGPET